MSTPVALVTGASRGIGKATALAFADAGFDVAITARTREEGERYEHASSVKRSDTSPMPGSLAVTAREIEARGRRALPIRMDLLDLESVTPVADRVVAALGTIDVLVNNAVYTGPGNMDRLLDLPLEVIERTLRANVVAQVALVQHTLPHMLARGRGTIVDVSSAAGLNDPEAPAGAGGWSFAYGGSKAAFHRLAGILRAEHRGSGVRVFNLEPGFVTTEMVERQHRGDGMQAWQGAPPEVPAAVIVWLATHPEASTLEERTIHAQPFARERGLVPEWSA